MGGAPEVVADRPRALAAERGVPVVSAWPCGDVVDRVERALNGG